MQRQMLVRRRTAGMPVLRRLKGRRPLKTSLPALVTARLAGVRSLAARPPATIPALAAALWRSTSGRQILPPGRCVTHPEHDWHKKHRHGAGAMVFNGDGRNNAAVGDFLRCITTLRATATPDLAPIRSLATPLVTAI